MRSGRARSAGVVAPDSSMTWEARASALSIVLRARPPTTRPKASVRLATSRRTSSVPAMEVSSRRYSSSSKTSRLVSLSIWPTTVRIWVTGPATGGGAGTRTPADTRAEISRGSCSRVIACSDSIPMAPSSRASSPAPYSPI